MKKTIVNVLLGLCTLGLAYACFWSIYEDISFDELKKEREQAVIQRLTQIRDVQEMYKQRYGYYCGDMDSIVLYVQQGKAVRGIVEEGEISDDEIGRQTQRQGYVIALVGGDHHILFLRALAQLADIERAEDEASAHHFLLLR